MPAAPHQVYCLPQHIGLTSACSGISALGGWWGVALLAPAEQYSYPSFGNQGGTLEFIGPRTVRARNTLKQNSTTFIVAPCISMIQMFSHTNLCTCIIYY
jgi:hypothetical protein